MNYLQTILNEFPDNCSMLEKRIRYFEFVRDIPYSIGPHEPEEVVAQRTGDCAGKCRLLADLFATLDIPARYILARYRLPDFPAEVQYIPAQCDYHHAAEFMVDEKWTLADPTFDPPLAKLGFTVNMWDGINPTPMCVHALSTKRGDEDDQEFMREKAAHDRAVYAAYEEHPTEMVTYTWKFNKILKEARDT